MADAPARLQRQLAVTAARVRKRAFITKSIAAQLDRSASGAELKKCLGALDLTFLGIGGIIGSGVFVLTGVAARELAGPGVIVSYVVAALAALLSALSYTEFVVEMPVAGGAFNYISLVFGELIAWVVAANLILEYTLSAAAVARGFSAYMATLVGLEPADVIIQAGILQIDISAAVLIVLLCALLATGTSESSKFNMVVTGLNLVVIVYVMAAGFPFGKASNLSPFLPFGARGIFSAASVVFFSFIGFDTVALAAEEVKNPAVDLPVGIVGSLLICTLLYALMSLAITVMRPYQLIDVHAPFSAAFLDMLQPGDSGVKRAFLHVSARFVSFGAVTGIMTSLMVALLGQARVYVVLGREALLPPWLAAVHPQRGTPVHATWLTAATAGILALLVDIEALAELVSIGTLFVFFCVSAGVLFRRYYQPGVSRAQPAIVRLLAIAISAVGFAISYTFEAPWPVLLVFGLAWLAATAWIHWLPVVFMPAKFTVPLSPFTPSLGMLCTIYLIGSLGWIAYVRFLVWLVVSLLVYVCYGVHGAEERERMRLDSDTGEGPGDAVYLNVVSPSGPSVELGSVRSPSPAATGNGHIPRKYEVVKANGRLLDKEVSSSSDAIHLLPAERVMHRTGSASSMASSKRQER